MARALMEHLHSKLGPFPLHLKFPEIPGKESNGTETFKISEFWYSSRSPNVPEIRNNQEVPFYSGCVLHDFAIELTHPVCFIITSSTAKRASNASSTLDPQQDSDKQTAVSDEKWRNA